MLRDGLMLLTAIVGLLGALLTVLPFALTAMSSPRRWEAWQRLVLVGFGCWILGSIASFVGTLGLAAGQMLIAQALNELVIVAGLWGFAACVTLAVGFRIFPNFLLLQPMRTRSMAGATVLYGLGLALVGAGWSGQAVSDDQLSTWQMLRAMGWLFLTSGGAGLIWSLRIFEAPLRESVAPHITYPTKLWFRIAYTYFLLSLGMGSWFAVREWLNGVIPDGTALSAQRHAIAMGYLMPIIVGMAGRILPEFSAEMARRQKVLTALVWSWIVGAGLRIGGELWTGYNTPGMIVMVAGATLAFLGFAWFSVRLWVSIGRRKPETIGV
jgi:hypothetical protein